MLREHPHIKILLDNVRSFREGQLDIGGLQKNLSSIMSTLEGDIPKPIHEAIFKAEACIDSIRFTVSVSDQREAAHKILRELEVAIEEYDL